MASSPTPVPFIIAIDGPAGAGKSTAARALAERLDFFLLDTGAIYRALALACVRRGISLYDGPSLGKMAAELDIRFENDKVYVGPEDVTAAIRTPAVSQASSTISAHKEVRAALLGLQRRIALRGRCVVEGRDIGTVVLPDAPLKFFLTASEEVRAQRRYEELRAQGSDVQFQATLTDLRDRDLRDASREVAPLRKADDAVSVDTSDLPLAEVIGRLEKMARTRFEL
jgi:cytidylate kinase